MNKKIWLALGFALTLVFGFTVSKDFPHVQKAAACDAGEPRC